MSSKPRRPPAELPDQDVWNQYVEQVKPLPLKGVALAEPKKRALRDRPIVAAPLHLAYQPNSKSALGELDRNERRRLGRGTLAVDELIDLHGMTQAAAHRRLLHFLHAAQNARARLVLVITGKGREEGAESNVAMVSLSRGVLRRAVPMWLREPDFRAIVAAVSPAASHHGGDGALYVRLRSARHRSR